PKMSPELTARRFRRRRAPAAALGVAILWAFACTARAEIPTFGVSETTSRAIAPEVEVLADPHRRGSAPRMLSPEAQFEPPLGFTPNFGIDETPRWYRFALRNESSTDRLHVYLDVGYPGLDRVTLHHVEGGEMVSETTGNSLPFSEKPIRFPTFLFRVALEPGETRTFAFEIESTSVHSVSIQVSGDRKSTRLNS